MLKTKMTYGDAINNAHRLALRSVPSCFVIGQGVNNPWFVGRTTTGLIDEFGTERVMDCPVSESVVTGACIGAAMAGARPIVFHPRMDFMYLTLDQIINHCASWSYMFNGNVPVPVIIRGIVNRRGEQGAQHSQSPFSIYTSIPGLKVVTPATPYDAKGLLLAALEDMNPVIYIDDRDLYDQEEFVPEEYYTIPIGEARIAREGEDITIIAASSMVTEAAEAAKLLSNDGVSCEIIDLRSLKPVDFDTINASVRKTKRAVVCILEWNYSSLSSHIAYEIYRTNFNILKHPVLKVNLPDIPAPASKSLEDAYYPTHVQIADTVRDILNKN